MNYLPGLLSDDELLKRKPTVEPILLADAGLLQRMFGVSDGVSTTTKQGFKDAGLTVKGDYVETPKEPSPQDTSGVSDKTVEGWKDYAKNLEDAKERWELANSARVKFETDAARFESKKKANPYLPDFVLHGTVAPKPVPLTPAQRYILDNPPPYATLRSTKPR